MADSIKIGNIDVSYFKVGGADCSIYIGDVKMYPTTPPTPHDYSQDYFTMVVVGEDGTFSWNGTSTANCLSYSLDSGATWSTPSSAITTSTLSNGDIVMWKGSNMSPQYNGIGQFKSSVNCLFDAQGNIMSLLFGDNFIGQTDLSGYNRVFMNLFISKVVNAENLILPATTLTNKCYQGMFNGCASLTTAPELPATTLANGCYSNMFEGCTSLTTAPSVLPATTLAINCYSNMFEGCTSLSAITCLATDISASNCINKWVRNVAASGTFTKDASMTGWTTGDNGIPSRWTVQDYNPPTPNS